MRSKLLTVAIAAGLELSAISAHAQNTSFDQRNTTSTNDALQALKTQLAALQAKVDTLLTQQNVQAATASSQMAVAPSTDTEKRLDKLEKLVNDTSVSGKMYVDFSNINQTNSDTGKTDASGTGIDVKRFYLGIDHKFNDIWSANLTTDFNYVSNDGETNLFVKKAYVQGKFDQALVLRVGASDMPWIPFVENYYGFRYVENTLTDRLKYANSSDWGVNVGGKVGAGGMFNYDVAVVNGNGYKNPSRSDSMDVEARVGVSPFEDFVVALGGYSGKRGQDLVNVNTNHSASRGDLLIAYAGKTFRLGGEYFTATDWNNVLKPTADKADGYSVWGSIALNRLWQVFARYDYARLSEDIDPGAKDNYNNAGIQYQVTKGFKVAGVYKYEKRDASVLTPLPLHVQNVKTNEIGVFGQLDW